MTKSEIAKSFHPINLFFSIQAIVDGKQSSTCAWQTDGSSQEGVARRSWTHRPTVKGGAHGGGASRSSDPESQSWPPYRADKRKRQGKKICSFSYEKKYVRKLERVFSKCKSRTCRCTYPCVYVNFALSVFLIASTPCHNRYTVKHRSHLIRLTFHLPSLFRSSRPSSSVPREKCTRDSTS